MREVVAKHPDIVEKLTVLADAARAELEDFNRPGRGQRPAGHFDKPQPLIN
jgi:hypothetical protein